MVDVWVVTGNDDTSHNFVPHALVVAHEDIGQWATLDDGTRSFSLLHPSIEGWKADVHHMFRDPQGWTLEHRQLLFRHQVMPYLPDLDLHNPASIEKFLNEQENHRVHPHPRTA